VALENIIKYGILVDPSQWVKFLMDPSILPSIQILLALNVFILISFWIEKYLLANDILSEMSAKVLIIGNIITLLILPPYIVFISDCNPVGSSFALFQVAIVFLKLTSYHIVNFWCRTELKKRFSHSRVHSCGNFRRFRSYSQNERSKKLPNGDHSLFSDIESSPPRVHYPDNLNLSDIYYFIFAPTLCYEMNFPRTQRIRKRFLFRRFFEMVKMTNNIDNQLIDDCFYFVCSFS